MKRLFALALCLACLLGLAAPAFAAELTMCDLVVFARFKNDVTNECGETNFAKIYAMFNGNLAENMVYGANVDDSFKAYINAVSDGKLAVEVTFAQEAADGKSAGVFTLSGTYDDYDDSQGIIGEVIDAFNEGNIPLTLPAGLEPDNVYPGVLDNLTVVVQGDDEYETTANPVLHPHRATYGGTKKITALDCYVSSYNIIDTASLFDGTMAQGVISHEFLHTVGFGDLYRYNTSGSPVGFWSVMSRTGRFQMFPLAFERFRMGWLPLETLTPAGGSSQTVTLDRATLAEGRRGYIIKTPMSETEFFVIEFRRTLDFGGSLKYGFDTKLTDSGLLIYRVNTAVEGFTNQLGTDYIYIFRPGETSNTASEGDINKAAVTPWVSSDSQPAVTSYGSAVMTKSCDKNTIFYSDGRNSGIVISGISGNDGANSDKLTLTVNFPNYDAMGLWTKAGSDAASSCNSCSLALASDGTPWMTAGTSTDEGWAGDIYVGTLSNGAWQSLPSPGKGHSPRLAFLGDTPVIIYVGQNYDRVFLTSYKNGVWTEPVEYVTDQSYTSIFGGSDTLYFCYLSDESTLELHTLTASGVGAAQTLTESGKSITAPALAVYEGKPYIAYSLMSGWNLENTKIARLDNGTFSTVYTGSTSGNLHAAAVGDKLYFLAGVSFKKPVLYSFDGTDWSSPEEPVDTAAASALALTADEKGAYIGIVSGSTAAEAKVFYKSGGAWERLHGDVSTYFSGMELAVKDGVVYVGSVSTYETGGALRLYSNPLPWARHFTVSLTEDGATVSLYSKTALKGSIITAVYNDDGQMLSAKLGTLSPAAGVSKSYPVPFSGGADEARAFILDALKPVMANARS